MVTWRNFALYKIIILLPSLPLIPADFLTLLFSIPPLIPFFLLSLMIHLYFDLVM